SPRLTGHKPTGLKCILPDNSAFHKSRFLWDFCRRYGSVMSARSSGRGVDPLSPGHEEIEAFREAFLHAIQTASPGDCRRHARRCEALAAAEKHEVCAEAYLRMALCWRRAAAYRERLEVLSSPRGRPPEE